MYGTEGEVCQPATLAVRKLARIAAYVQALHMSARATSHDEPLHRLRLRTLKSPRWIEGLPATSALVQSLKTQCLLSGCDDGRGGDVKTAQASNGFYSALVQWRTGK